MTMKTTMNFQPQTLLALACPAHLPWPHRESTATCECPSRTLTLNSVPLPGASKGIDSEVMYAFYQRLFPFRYLFQWLNHGVKPSPDFGNREFAFTLQNDAYLRYQSFATADLLRKDILRLNPSRFEIGPQYSANPRDRKTLQRKTSTFRPISKELVFDIDLTDYDEIRTCCDKANICHKCWTFITMAIRVIDVALRDDFGFDHILWVYSGRRGAHAWICDQRARNLPDDKRRAIAGYLELVKGGSQAGKKVNVKRPLHPHISRSLEILKPFFASAILKDQDPFQSSTGSERLLALLPDASLVSSLRKKWDSSPGRSSTAKWADIDTLAKSGASKTLDPQRLLEAKQDIVLEYTYPRLDVEVSKKLIHLLKSPFVVHPGTGRVCVPIDTAHAEDFDPLGVPTVNALIPEIDDWDAANVKKAGSDDEMDIDNNNLKEEGNSTTTPAPSSANPTAAVKKIPDYEKTSLKPFVDYFRGFVNGLLRDERVVKREREEEGAVAVKKESMDF